MPEINEVNPSNLTMMTGNPFELQHLARQGGTDKTCKHISGFAGPGRKLCPCGKGWIRK